MAKVRKEKHKEKKKANEEKAAARVPLKAKKDDKGVTKNRKEYEKEKRDTKNEGSKKEIKREKEQIKQKPKPAKLMPVIVKRPSGLVKFDYEVQDQEIEENATKFLNNNNENVNFHIAKKKSVAVAQAEDLQSKSGDGKKAKKTSKKSTPSTSLEQSLSSLFPDNEDEKLAKAKLYKTAAIDSRYKFDFELEKPKIDESSSSKDKSKVPTNHLTINYGDGDDDVTATSKNVSRKKRKRKHENEEQSERSMDQFVADIPLPSGPAPLINLSAEIAKRRPQTMSPTSMNYQSEVLGPITIMNKQPTKTSPTITQRQNAEVEKSPQFFGPQLPKDWPTNEAKREPAMNLNEEAMHSDNNNRSQKPQILQPHRIITMQMKQNTRPMPSILAAKHEPTILAAVKQEPTILAAAAVEHEPTILAEIKQEHQESTPTPLSIASLLASSFPPPTPTGTLHSLPKLGAESRMTTMIPSAISSKRPTETKVKKISSQHEIPNKSTQFSMDGGNLASIKKEAKGRDESETPKMATKKSSEKRKHSRIKAPSDSPRVSPPPPTHGKSDLKTRLRITKHSSPPAHGKSSVLKTRLSSSNRKRSHRQRARNTSSSSSTTSSSSESVSTPSSRSSGSERRRPKRRRLSDGSDRIKTKQQKRGRLEQRRTRQRSRSRSPSPDGQHRRRRIVSTHDLFTPPMKPRLNHSLTLGFAYSPTPRKTPVILERSDGRGRIAPFFTNAYVFSNHFPAKFTIDGRTFTSSEQYYMYYKAFVFGEKKLAERLMGIEDPKEMKRLCTGTANIRRFDSVLWKRVSAMVMSIGCYQKFAQNKYLRRLLFETGDAQLVEAAPGDRYWGVGLGVNNPNINDVKRWRGGNLLGVILTKAREALAKMHPDEWKDAQRVFQEQTMRITRDRRRRTK